MSSPRLIMYHKHATSARTRFLKLAYGGVCGFSAFPAQARVTDPLRPPARVVRHPAAIVREAEAHLDLPSGSLEVEPGFRCEVEADQELTQVFLARFKSIDPPFEAAHAQGGRFIDLTQARGLPPVELELLRRSYEQILG
ncbi:hypothetical protein CKO25_07080 [Thiocapsa imhoffii]|uniref:Uncharacterized protein n=1 Tax=Thiocapsa imhoffii TaxID=382777 RepID=A0A9X0WH10_9GAMM|nr:hypothetical protein [Thiocapsa imhoffii]MBK1644423.1 hypothetical protein [Thiocapsa imhoffii]